MKKIIIFLLIISIIPIYSQKGIISYTATLSIGSSGNKYSEKEQELIQKMLNSSDDIDYTLTINKEKALFVKLKKMEKDDDANLNFTNLLAGDIFYTDLHKNENIESKYAFGQDFLITHESVKWNLSTETKVINTYNCKKATTTIEINRRGVKVKKKVVAWYASDIPLNFGPKFYNGLPGLILELQEGKLKFNATKIILNPKGNIILKKPINGELVTTEELSKIAIKLRNR